MNRSIKVAVAAGLATLLLTGVTYAATRPVPENQPQVALQNTTAATLPGDSAALDAALKAAGPVTYKVLVIDSTDGEDKTDYLDRVASQWTQPAADTLLLVIFTQDNYDIRFYMGANFRANNVTVDEMLKFVRTAYLPKARVKDAAGGLVDLINAVNARMGGKAAAESKPADKAPITVSDPFGGGRRTAVQEIELAKALLSGHLSQYKGEAVNENERLADWKIDDAKIYPIETSDTKIVYRIVFSVLPAKKNNSAWMAGNGTVGDGGWIVDKTIFLTTEKEGPVWTLKSMTTSP